METKPVIETTIHNIIGDGVLIIPKIQQSEVFFKYRTVEHEFLSEIEVLHKDLSINQVWQLKDLAKTIGIKGYTKCNKAALVALLKPCVVFE